MPSVLLLDFFVSFFCLIYFVWFGELLFGWFVCLCGVFLIFVYLDGVFFVEDAVNRKKVSKLQLFSKEHILPGNYLSLLTYLSCLMQ